MKKMAQTLYGSLLVIALCSLSECVQRRYHYINMNKNWTEAQRYCRENYTDLATVDNMNDMNQLINTVNNSQVHVWIGLKKTSVYKWKWSLGDPVKYQNWETEPSSDNTNNCAVMRNGTWHQQKCDEKMSFICYNDSSKAHFIETSNQTWSEAQSFCRQHHTDLTSVRNQTENQLIQNIINNPQNQLIQNIINNPQNQLIQNIINNTQNQLIQNIINNTQTSVWIGLFRDSFKWSDNTDSGFRYWGSGEPNNVDSPPGVCTESQMNDHGQWNDAGCSTSETFVCHEDKLILVQKNLSWTEALSYCRQNHVDLVSVDSEEIQHWVTAVLHRALTAEVWLGLRHSCVVGVWFWVNGEVVCYENWAPGNETAVDGCGHEVRSGAVQSGGNQTWISLPESKQLNFICIKYE